MNFYRMFILKWKNVQKNWRKGQSVFNVVDEHYGVARSVQFIDHVDCFYNDDKISEFLTKAYIKLTENESN